MMFWSIFCQQEKKNEKEKRKKKKRDSFYFESPAFKYHRGNQFHNHSCGGDLSIT